VEYKLALPRLNSGLAADHSVVSLGLMCCAQQTGMHMGCGSTAYSVGTVYKGKGHLYTPGVWPVLLATPCLAPLAITLLITGDHLVDDAQLMTPC
jgi:hypothetical protein